jgi:Right handed beta helix region
LRNLKRAFVALFIAAKFLSATELTVSKDGRGDFNTIQAAIDRSRQGDRVTILDASVYEEQVTIRAPLHHFTLRSANPDSPQKPVIRWLDQVNVGPKNCLESLDTAKFTSERNGALRLIGVRNVRIEGVAVDAVESKPFAYNGVWGNGKDCNGQLSPLFHGNTGIVLLRTGNTIIRNSEVKNAYFGIHIKDQDRGPFRIQNAPGATPLSRMALGNHLIEGNVIHLNTWGFFLESAWGLGSTYRNNFVYRNHHPDGQAAQIRLMPDGSHQNSGAFLLKDGLFSSQAIHNNTFAFNYLILSGHFRTGVTHLFANNIIAEPHLYWSNSTSFQNPFHEMLPYLPNRIKHNAISAQVEKPKMVSKMFGAELYDSIAQKNVTVEKRVEFFQQVRIMNGFPMPILTDSQVDVIVPLSSGSQIVKVPIVGQVSPGNLIFDNSRVNPALTLPASAKNRWLETQFLSEIPGDSNFFRPTPPFREFMRDGWADLKMRDASGQIAPIGALRPSEKRLTNLRITPLAPSRIVEGHLILDFIVESPQNSQNRISYLRHIPVIPYYSNSFAGANFTGLLEADTLPLTQAPLGAGYHQIRIPLGNLKRDSLTFGSVEMAVEGGNDLSNIASFPIIPLSPIFNVEVMNESGTPASEVENGSRLNVRVSYRQQPLQTHPIALYLASGAHLELLDSAVSDSTGLIRAPLPLTLQIRLNEIPVGGADLICATAFTDSTMMVMGYGQSQALKFTDGSVSIRPKARRQPTSIQDHRLYRNLLGRKAEGDLYPSGPGR